MLPSPDTLDDLPIDLASRARGRRRPVRALGVAIALALVLVATACGGGDDKSSTPTTSGSDGFTLWAVSDIQPEIEAAVRNYNKRFPDVQVTTVFGTAAELNDRLLVGERPDLYVGTGAQLNALGDDGTLPKDSRLFATDALVIAVAPGNPKQIADYTVFGLDPLTRSGLCKPDVSCGRTARAVLSELKIVPAPDASEADAKALVNRVVEGELDAALVYRTDAVKAVQNEQIGIVRVSTGGDKGTTEFRIVIVHPGEAVDSFLRYVKKSKVVNDMLKARGLAPLAAAPAPTAGGDAGAGDTSTSAPAADAPSDQPN